ncbi:(d)CMP kinase [Brevibacillus dissolubilis]|uniref:(d)CMP kinase n=1 Tax=Brevibacillus dissolubilis TaxID=1844116 RepID=UPI001115DB95|nr:(d)CMP kinase [Brevibacillus dissolubilis]
MKIAIDGPAGAGKSTVAQQIASELNFVYIDTGAMYRALAWATLQQGVPVDNQQEVSALLTSARIELRREEDGQHVYWNDQDITSLIRTQEVSNHASIVASYGDVRAQMLVLQRMMAESGNVVMDGRDIGTHVLPNADVKIFLTASVDERAQRRYAELIGKGNEADLEQLKQEIAERDKRDSEREVAPLRQADDAVLVDTTGLSIDQVVDKILTICKQAGEGSGIV